MPIMARSHAVTCSAACRKRRSRASTVPRELRSRARWVTHTAAKVPTTPAGRPASSTNPATWSPWSKVADEPRRGFVLAGDGIVCIDLDHCLERGRVAPWAQEILDACPSTFVEVSQSGTGLHVWGWARMDGGRVIRDGDRCVEVYASGRYIAVTGRRFRGAPSRLADVSSVVDAVLQD